jgi:hypothetical protein
MTIEDIPCIKQSIADEAIQRELGKFAGGWRYMNSVAAGHLTDAKRARADANNYASVLIKKLTPRLVLQRLSALPPGMATIITSSVGKDLSDAHTRARVFEACDYAQHEGPVDESALIKHLKSTKGYPL